MWKVLGGATRSCLARCAGRSRRSLEGWNTPFLRKVKTTPDPDTFEKCRDTHALLLAERSIPCPSFPCFFGKWQGKPPKEQGFFIPTEPLKSLEKKRKTLKKTRNSLQGQKNKEFQKTRKGRTGYIPPICITILLPFVSRYFCRSIRVRGRWDTPNKFLGTSFVPSSWRISRELASRSSQKSSTYYTRAKARTNSLSLSDFGSWQTQSLLCHRCIEATLGLALSGIRLSQFIHAVLLQGVLSGKKPLTAPFCWTKFPSKDTKCETKFPKISPKLLWNPPRYF